jgi:DNA repair ATPase RecN
MAEVTNELMYEVLKQLQDRMTSFDKKLDEVRSEMQAMRIHSVAVQQDIQNIYSIFARHDGRLERIERRLEVAEVSG